MKGKGERRRRWTEMSKNEKEELKFIEVIDFGKSEHQEEKNCYMCRNYQEKNNRRRQENLSKTRRKQENLGKNMEKPTIIDFISTARKKRV